jgi:YesN/AraC family two-component response regulator
MNLFDFVHRKVHNEPAIPLFLLTFYELTCVFSGSMLYYINNKKVTLNAGDILFAKKGSKRRRAVVSDCHYISFNFYEENADEFLDLPVLFEKGITKEIQLLLSVCSELSQTADDDNDRLQLLCLCILKQLKINFNTKNYSELTQHIIRYINEHLSEKITLNDIAHATFFSPSHCSLIFKKEIGKPIINYIIDEKMKQAKKFIIEGVSLKETAQKLGFDDYNYFSRLFKNRENMTPLQYKQFLYSPYSTKKKSR